MVMPREKRTYSGLVPVVDTAAKEMVTLRTQVGNDADRLVPEAVESENCLLTSDCPTLPKVACPVTAKVPPTVALLVTPRLLRVDAPAPSVPRVDAPVTFRVPPTVALLATPRLLRIDAPAPSVPRVDAPVTFRVPPTVALVVTPRLFRVAAPEEATVVPLMAPPTTVPEASTAVPTNPVATTFPVVLTEPLTKMSCPKVTLDGNDWTLRVTPRFLTRMLSTPVAGAETNESVEAVTV